MSAKVGASRSCRLFSVTFCDMCYNSCTYYIHTIYDGTRTAQLWCIGVKTVSQSLQLLFEPLVDGKCQGLTIRDPSPYGANDRRSLKFWDRNAGACAQPLLTQDEHFNEVLLLRYHPRSEPYLGRNFVKGYTVTKPIFDHNPQYGRHFWSSRQSWTSIHTTAAWPTGWLCLRVHFVSTATEYAL